MCHEAPRDRVGAQHGCVHRPGWPGSSHENQDFGEQVGRTVAARFVQRAAGETGLALGRAVAAWAIVHDVKGHESFTLR
jgi:hypothetical protein